MKYLPIYHDDHRQNFEGESELPPGKQAIMQYAEQTGNWQITGDVIIRKLHDLTMADVQTQLRMLFELFSHVDGLITYPHTHTHIYIY